MRYLSTPCPEAHIVIPAQAGIQATKPESQ